MFFLHVFQMLIQVIDGGILKGKQLKGFIFDIFPSLFNSQQLDQEFTAISSASID
jgi:hypothetical protein